MQFNKDIQYLVEDFDFNKIQNDENFSDKLYQDWFNNFNTKDNTYIFKSLDNIFGTEAVTDRDKKFLLVYIQNKIDEFNNRPKKVVVNTRDELKAEIRKQINAMKNYPDRTINLNYLDVSNITDMHGLFKGYHHPNKLAVDEWDVSNVTDMKEMFYGTTRLFSDGIDISKWNTGKVLDMNSMFYYSTFNGDISNWDVSNVESMAYMFTESTFDSDISKWNTHNVLYMTGMFRRSLFNQDISKWNVSRVVDMLWMFQEAIFNQPIGNWDVSHVRDMCSMFDYNKKFNQDISKWNVSKVERMLHMFYNTEAFDLDLSKWKRSLYCRINYDMGSIFQGSGISNQPEKLPE